MAAVRNAKRRKDGVPAGAGNLRCRGQTIGRARQGGHDIPAAARNLRYRSPTRKERRAGEMPALRVFGTDGRREFAGDEGVEDAKAGGKLDGGPTRPSGAPAERQCRRNVAFL